MKTENLKDLSISEYKGHRKISFTVGGRESYIVCPENPLPDSRWAWRAEFFGAFDTVDMALLEKGWYLAYHRVSDMYGCPESIEMMKRFYDTAVNDAGLNKKTVLFGFSRGGLYSVNFAAAYPECTAELYLDAPVLDINSWPGGRFKGMKSEIEWQDGLNLYGLTEETAKTFSGNPLNKAHFIARHGIPVIIVAGASDEVVPFEENSAKFVPVYRKYSDDIKLIVKPHCGHHPHSLEDPAPVVGFIEKHFAPSEN